MHWFALTPAPLPPLGRGEPGAYAAPLVPLSRIAALETPIGVIQPLLHDSDERAPKGCLHRENTSALLSPSDVKSFLFTPMPAPKLPPPHPSPQAGRGGVRAAASAGVKVKRDTLIFVELKRLKC